MPAIALAHTPAQIERCFPVLLHLRPHLLAAEFVGRVQAQQLQGYHLACIEENGAVVAAAGFRILELLATGRTLYVDDLVTDPAHRSHGHGKALLDWMEHYARRAGCQTFSLDSGTPRHEAHAFYFRERLRISSFHFMKRLD